MRLARRLHSHCNTTFNTLEMPVSEPLISVTPEEFEKKFRDVIRVGLNWDRFLEQRWPVDLVRLTTDEELQRCFVPWYIGPKGEEVAYDDRHAIPMRLTDVPKAFEILNDERKSDIQQYVDSFREKADVIAFSVPTYALPDHQYFVLDRNHRLSALTLNPVKFEVTLWNVRGPMDTDCLLDLNHWLQKDKLIPPDSGTEP